MGMYVALALGIVVRIALLIAIGQVWGLIPAVLVLFVLVLTGVRISNMRHPIWFGVGVLIEIVVLVTGLVAVNSAWGSIWVGAILLGWVIGAILHVKQG